jgi:YidC/Oxa1 family membrane protein insertase
VKWLVAPIGEYVILPTLSFLHTFIANYGIVIILFSLLMKIRTATIQCFADEINAEDEGSATDYCRKYKRSTKMIALMLSQETMKIYSEYGINPAGGCLPMIMQMPILFHCGLF